MPTYNDYGIVLKGYNLAEQDKILNIYTKENGLVRAVCKGLRKHNSKFSGKVDQFSCCNFQFASGKNLHIICECEQINGFPLLRSDLHKLTYGILFLEIVINFAHELESESNEVYELLYKSLDELGQTLDPELLLVKFIVNFLSIHGLKPQLDTCVSCSKNITGTSIYPYSSVLGGLLCNECEKIIDNEPVGKSVIEIISKLDNCKIKEDLKLALKLLREHLNARAKSQIKSFDLVFSL